MKSLFLALIIGFFAVTTATEAEAGRGFRKSAKASSSLVKKIFISKKRFPQSAKHIADAQKAGAPKILTVDREGAAARRRAALNGKTGEPGKDRDEYPPALTREGGKNASVRNIPSADNRGSGACVGAQCRDVPDGGSIKITVTD